MTSFADYPNTMPSHDFNLYSSHEDYSSLPATSHSYFPTTTYFDTPYSVAMSTLDSYPGMQAYSNTSETQEFRYNMDSVPQNEPIYQQYSPVESPANSTTHSFECPPPHLSTASESGASIQSTQSSAIGSPLHPQYHEQWDQLTGLGLAPGIVHPDVYNDSFASTGFEHESYVVTDKLRGCVDPTLINPFPSPIAFPATPYPEINSTPSPRIPFYEHPPSPSPSNASACGQQQRSGSSQFKKSGSQSPYLRTVGYAPYSQYQNPRRPSASPIQSRHSPSSRRSASYELDDESRERGLCPIPECGRMFKDLKAHMLTHQNERPEKCPIITCEYHHKGFARKYDKNRHTLTHYKGTMVCGFCPGSGSAAEKSFNRADVFKRHLTSVHGVEQTAPNSRKKSPTGKKAYSTAAQNTSAGTCSTCSVTFANAQEFYEHLDDCVLRVVQQAEPSEAINQKNLASVADDKRVQETMERHCLPNKTDYSVPVYDEEDEDEEAEFEEDDDQNDDTYGVRTSPSRSSKGVGARQHVGGGTNPTTAKNGITKTKAPRTGLTYSKGGVTLIGACTGRKKRKNYPASWGCSADKMKMKKRVVCVYDGPRRLWKDDMMLEQEYEVRMKLPGEAGNSYVTDLDVQTLKRAEAVHNMTEEEKGPWVRDNIFEE